MEEVQYSQQSFDISSRVRDIEERQELIRDRLLLVTKTLVDERDKNFKQIQEFKKTLAALKEENEKLKEFAQRVSELLEKTARKEELMILQRQFDLFRK